MFEKMNELSTIPSNPNTDALTYTQNKTISETYMTSNETNMTSNKNAPISYEEKRRELRYGNFTTMALIFKSTAGVCYFNYHFPIYRVGIVLSLIYNIFIGYLTTYGIYRVTQIANNIDCKKGSAFNDTTAENENNIVRVFHELPIKLKIPNAKSYQILLLICCSIVTASSCIANLSLMASVISFNSGIHLLLSKILLVIFFS